TNSVFTVAESFQYFFTGDFWGSAGIQTCGHANVDHNTFNGVQLRVGECAASIRNNTFMDIDSPLVLLDHPDLAMVDLAGADANQSAGSAPRRAVTARGTIGDHSTWAVSTPDSNAVLVSAGIKANYTLLAQNGSIELLPGTVVKGSGQWMFDLGPTSEFSA